MDKVLHISEPQFLTGAKWESKEQLSLCGLTVSGSLVQGGKSLHHMWDFVSRSPSTWFSSSFGSHSPFNVILCSGRSHPVIFGGGECWSGNEIGHGGNF